MRVQPVSATSSPGASPPASAGSGRAHPASAEPVGHDTGARNPADTEEP